MRRLVQDYGVCIVFKVTRLLFINLVYTDGSLSQLELKKDYRKIERLPQSTKTTKGANPMRK